MLNIPGSYIVRKKKKKSPPPPKKNPSLDISEKKSAALEADLSYTAEVCGGILGAQDPLRYPDRILCSTSSDVIHL